MSVSLPVYLCEDKIVQFLNCLYDHVL